MKNKIQMVDDDQVENVGIMSGFMDDLEGLLEELSAEEMEGMEEGDEADIARTMGRSPDSPEILMNNLRGDIRSIDARREELSDLVGFREAEETPEGVLALLQPVLAQQQAAPPMPMPMPPQGMPPQGMPPQGMPPQQLAAGGPVGYADGGAPVSQLFGNADAQARAEAQAMAGLLGIEAQAAAEARAAQTPEYQQAMIDAQAMLDAQNRAQQGTSMPPIGAREAMPEPPQGTPVYEPMPPMYDPEAMPISPDDAAIRDLLLQQGRQVAPPVAGPATEGIGSLAPPVAPVNGINDEGIMRRMQEEQLRRMEEEQLRRMEEERMPRPPYDPRMPRPPYDPRMPKPPYDPRMPMPPYDPRMPMPPYDPRTGGVGKPIYDVPQLPLTDIGYDPMPKMYDPMPISPAGFPTPPPVMPVGTPVDQRPMFAPQRMPAFSPPPDSGVGALFAPTNAPRFMADGGMVQNFQDGSDAAGVTPSGTYSPETIAEAVRRLQERMGQQPEAVPTLKAGMDEALPMYQELLGSDPSNTQAQMLFDIGQAALGYAGNVGPDGQPLRGSAAARLAGATRELPGRIGARAAGMAKEEQALRMAALQAAQGERSAAQARNAALYDQQSELYKDIATREPAARMLMPEEVTAMGLDSEAGAWGIDGEGKPFLAGGRTPASLVDMGENTLEKVGVTALAEGLTNQYNAALNATGNIRKIDETITLLQNSDADTGFGAEFRQSIRKAQSLYSEDPELLKTLTDTELLNSALGQNVFGAINSLGIGARGIDTPAEREFLREVLAGRISLTKDALLEMARIRRRAEENNIMRWNDTLQSGRADSLIEVSRGMMPDTPLTIPVDPITGEKDTGSSVSSRVNKLLGR